MDRKFYLPGGLTNGKSSLPVAIMAQVGQSGCLLMSNPDSCKIISKLDQRFLRRFFKNFFMSVSCKKPQFTRAMFMDRSKFCEHFLKNITQGIFLCNYFKIWPAVLEKNIFVRISSCPYSAGSPISPEPCLWTDQNFGNILEKGRPLNIPVKLFQNRTSSFQEEDFLRISSCLYSARRPHSPEPCFWMDQNFTNNFWKGSLKEHSCEIIIKSDQRFQRRRFFKNFFMSV